MITGPDCSRHQGVVDWNAVKADGHTFAFIKLTDGVNYKYIDWGRTNLPKVKAAGLISGAYHWLSKWDNPIQQARVYVAEVNRLGGFRGVVPIVDVEKDVDGSFPNIEQVRAFANEFHRLVPGRTMLIYTGKWFWASNSYLGNPYGANLGLLWHSEYELSVAEVEDGPELDSYGGWTRATVWQFTSNDVGLGMDVAGVSGRCDLNRFFGTMDDLRRLAGLDQDNSQVEEEDMKPYLVRNVDSGSVLLVTGGSAILIVNNAELTAHKARGLEEWGVSSQQFLRYESLRPAPPIDATAIANAISTAATTAITAALANIDLPDVTIDFDQIKDAVGSEVRAILLDAATE